MDLINLLKESLNEESITSIKDTLSSNIVEIKDRLDTLDTTREKIIKLTREIIRRSGWAIVEALKGDLAKATEHLQVCEDKTRELLALAEPYPELLHTGLVNNALSEYVEAKLFIEIIMNSKLPGYKELNIPPVPYLQGLGDLSGELKRLGLELIRNNEYELAERLLLIIEAIYLELRSLDYPEALLPGVRHKTDVARRIVDDFKTLLVDLMNRNRLTRILEQNLEYVSKREQTNT
ncbi:MAG: haloacid dehalogenase [Desulfurococcales archaeon]|nr:haloacid dehalogenase [Desulfurococcales archaeon]